MVADILDAIREKFPALARQQNGRPVVFFDGPAGTQVPQSVIDAIGNYLVRHNANHAGVFATSQESDISIEAAHLAVADLLGTDDPDTVCFGANMTTLTFAISRALARTWRPGDEVVVTRLDHDANVTPWVLAAADVGATVRYVDIDKSDCTLDLSDLRNKLSERTRLVAVGCASNAVGTINPVREICQMARDVGALSYLDAVHYAPHALIDVERFGCDFLTCSAYKFFGPHIGILWGRRALLEELSAYKLRPAPNDLPGKWMTGTQNHECLAGVLAAVDYLADLGRRLAGESSLQRRPALASAWQAIGDYESGLIQGLIGRLSDMSKLRVWGITDPRRCDERLPTISLTHDSIAPRELAACLAEQGIFAWYGNYYALQLTETLGLEPEGMVRIGLVHYNTQSEVTRLTDLLGSL